MVFFFSFYFLMLFPGPIPVDCVKGEV